MARYVGEKKIDKSFNTIWEDLENEKNEEKTERLSEEICI